MAGSDTSGGTGGKLGLIAIIITGVCALASTLLSLVSIWFQAKNYRKPLLQRYVIRILIMVPIYAIASWGSIMSLTAALYLDPIRDVYEAFTIYTFLQLLINFLGGERSLIIMMVGRKPVNHPWPLNQFLDKVDISDPHTFLAIKRGILQYTWLKPILSIANIIMKTTGIYREGYIGVDSGYFWESLIYNISVSVSLYALAMFWVCMSQDLKPFRPVPKFLCVKLIIFASYWQGLFLSVLQFLGAIPNDVKGYTSDNLAAAIQDALICVEMPLFAIGHWYAFSWHDYADKTISSARMPVKYALRDAFGPVDLIQDAKETFSGDHYEYRLFDSGDNVLAHEDSKSRFARMREGMRYTRDGKGKYWLPKKGEINARTPLLSAPDSAGAGSSRSRSPDDMVTNNSIPGNDQGVEETEIDPEDERLFSNAKALEFGDWNYPVVTAHIPYEDQFLRSDPELITTSTNRHVLHPTKKGKKRRETDVKRRFAKGKGRSDIGDQESSAPRAPVVEEALTRQKSGSSSRSGRSQLVDLVVEDTEAEEIERVRARKEGGAAWNEGAPKHYVRTYDDEDEGNDIRSGYEPNDIPAGGGPEDAIQHDEEEAGPGYGSSSREEGENGNDTTSPYGDMDDRDVWASRED